MKTILITTLLATASVAAHANPMAEFDNIFNQCKARYETRAIGEVTPGGASGTWVRKVHTESKLNYDIQQKRYSAPFESTVTIESVEQFASASSEAAARQLGPTPANRMQRDVVRIHFSNQGGVWRTTEADVSSESKSTTTAPWERAVTVRIGRDAILKSGEYWAACAR